MFSEFLIETNYVILLEINFEYILNMFAGIYYINTCI